MTSEVLHFFSQLEVFQRQTCTDPDSIIKTVHHHFYDVGLWAKSFFNRRGNFTLNTKGAVCHDVPVPFSVVIERSNPKR